MSKLKSILMVVWGALSVFFMLVIQRKNRKIEKQEEQIKQVTKDKEALKDVIHGAEQDAKKLQEIKKDIRSKPISSIVDELRKRGEYKD